MRSNDILIVDDEIGIRDLLSDILQDPGRRPPPGEDRDRRAGRRAREQARRLLSPLIPIPQNSSWQNILVQLTV